MDWAKAKTILIIVLLIICLLLSGVLIARGAKERAEDKLAAASAQEYLCSQGTSFNCDIPLERPSMPVLFVHFNNPTLNRTVILEEYKGIKVIANTSGYIPELSSAGKAKAKIITASSAVLKAAALAEDLKGLEIKNIELVYYIDPEGFNPTSEDTALPCWAVTTNRGTFYINGYNL